MTFRSVTLKNNIACQLVRRLQIKQGTETRLRHHVFFAAIEENDPAGRNLEAIPAHHDTNQSFLWL